MEHLLRKLTEIPGPSGQEEFIKETVVREVQLHCHQLWEDPLGNLIARTGPEERVHGSESWPIWMKWGLSLRAFGSRADRF